jgi:DNA-binding GntR family transcriptional regulator
MRPLEQRRSIAEVVAEHIREAILGGVYGQGERLIDARLAEELGISRGSVREGLRLLQAQGFVVQKPHHGTFVFRPSAADVRDTCELRIALETHAVRLLARTRANADLVAFKRLIERMEKAASAGDQLRVSKCDQELHENLTLRSGSGRLHEVYDREILGLLGFFGVDAVAYEPLTEMGREFGPLLQAMEAGDGDAAARLIELHIRRATDLLAHSIEASET